MPFSMAGKCTVYHIICPKPIFPSFMVIISLFLEQNVLQTLPTVIQTLPLVTSWTRLSWQPVPGFPTTSLCNEMLLSCCVDACVSGTRERKAHTQPQSPTPDWSGKTEIIGIMLLWGEGDKIQEARNQIGHWPHVKKHLCKAPDGGRAGRSFGRSEPASDQGDWLYPASAQRGLTAWTSQSVFIFLAADICLQHSIPKNDTIQECLLFTLWYSAQPLFLNSYK